MIASGVKTEEYREIKPFWIKRLCDGMEPVEHCPRCFHYREVVTDMRMECEQFRCEEIKQVTFTLGYPPRDDASKRMTFEVRETTIGYGREEWGAPKDRKVFIIKLGKRIK